MFREGPYRFFFFSREEPRIHVHVASSAGEAKFWIEPVIELAVNHGIPKRAVGEIQKIVEAHEQDIRIAWKLHFGTSSSQAVTCTLVTMIVSKLIFSTRSAVK